MLGLIVAFGEIHQRRRDNRRDQQQEEGGCERLFLRGDRVKQILQCGVVLREFQDAQQAQDTQHAQIEVREQEVQVERCGREKVDQTKEAENILFAASPGAALFRGVARAIRPGSQHILG